jgi:hypothetical protein
MRYKLMSVMITAVVTIAFLDDFIRFITDALKYQG